MRSRDSGAYDFWRLDMGDGAINKFMKRHSQFNWDPPSLDRELTLNRVRRDEIPEWWWVWDGMDGVTWWMPPQGERECRYYKWTDRLGNDFQWLVVDRKRQTLWIR